MLRPYRFTINVPSPHVPHAVHSHIRQADFPKQLRDVRATRRFGPRRRGDRGQRGLTGERRFIGALDMRSGGGNAIVGEKGTDHAAKLRCPVRLLQQRGPEKN
jgi:hypothetical protein